MCPCAARRRERLPSFVKNSIVSCGVKQTALQTALDVLYCPRTMRQIRARQKEGFCDASEVHKHLMIVPRKLATDMSAAALTV